MTLVRNDAIAPGLDPGRHAYEIHDDDGNVLGVVARGEYRGRAWWYAAQVMPNRKTMFGGVTVDGESRKAVVAEFVKKVRP